MIYIVAHKEFSLPKVDESYAPIFVGGQIRNRAIELKALYDKGNDSDKEELEGLLFNVSNSREFGN